MQIGALLLCGLPAQRAQVIKLRNEGEPFHNAGQRGEAEVVLEQAKAIVRVR